MSEVDFLIKQLEYCFNSKSFNPLPKILRHLMLFQGKVNISVRMSYPCSSHTEFFKCNKFFETTTKLYQFPHCNHLVCDDCMKAYLIPIYTRVGSENRYFCPGCISERSQDSTPIMWLDPFLDKYVEWSVREEVENRVTLTLQTIKNGVAVRKTRCYFADNPGEIRCTGETKVERVIKCNHPICYDCLLKYLEAYPEGEQIKCMSVGCSKFISHAFIRTALEANPELRMRYWRKLKTHGEVNLVCFSCSRCFSASQNVRYYRCSCGSEICTECGLASHSDIPCEIAMNSLDAYREEKLTGGMHFENARTLFQWNLHEGQKKKLESLGGIGLNFKSVTYIYNPLLLEKYERAKKEMINQGIDPGEINVYHGSAMKNYADICKKGLLIGSKDVKVAIGSVYGFGVYTATDPTMSIHFTQKNGTVLVCKLLVGKLSPEPIKNVKELDTTEFHSYFVDFNGVQSNYYVSFKSDYVLPYYLVEYS